MPGQSHTKQQQKPQVQYLLEYTKCASELATKTSKRSVHFLHLSPSHLLQHKTISYLEDPPICLILILHT